MATNSGKDTSRQSGQLWLVPRAGEAGHHLVADVAVRARTMDLHSFAVPPAIAAPVRPGATLLVSYGKRGTPREGICVAVSRREWDETLPPVNDVLPGGPLLTAALIELGLWIGAYYGAAPAQCLDIMVPAAARTPRMRAVRYLRATGRTDERPLTPRQRALLDALADGERSKSALAGIATPAIVRVLRQRGLVEQVTRQEPVDDAPPDDDAGSRFVPAPEDELRLTAAQREAIDAIHRLTDPPRFAVPLLFGVPGSGKTEVYVRAIRRVIEAGRQAILLVPEIALATQIVERLARRFERVAVMHSRLTSRQRVASLKRIRAGAVDVVIGTRTAAFAPCPRLGLIVVDEEQDTSFKSLATPYFHARDVAIKRGQIEGVPVVLGSATPALETWRNAQSASHYSLLRLPERVPGAALPRATLVPRREHQIAGKVLSEELLAALRETLDDGRQAILLHNRRGYAALLRCTQCQLPVRCTRCGTHMVHHRVDDTVKCHRCGRREPAPTRCLDDTCGGPLERTGFAIQRLEEELGRVLPAARLLRADADTMRRRADYERVLRSFAGGGADILLGTQMIAKGLDFPAVRLVGVIDADESARLPDFRAGEHTFQLLVQVVGRAGRAETGGRAIVQCSSSAGDLVRDALRMDYESFATAELEARRELRLPPYWRLVRLVLADEQPARARAQAEKMAARFREIAGRLHGGVRVDEAEPCIVGRLRGRSRYQVVIHLPREIGPAKLIRAAIDADALWPRVQRFVLDVDPIDMM